MVAAVVLVRRRLSWLDGVPRALAVAVLITTGVIAVHLVPGLVGLLSRESVLICAVLVLTLTLLIRAPEFPSRDSARPRPADSGPASWILTSVAMGAFVLWTLATAWMDAVTASSDVDTLTFHLPNVARWIQSGTFWQIDQFTPLLANGNYPQHGDLVFLAAVLPWDNDAFIRLVAIPFAAVAGLAVYAIAQELRAPRAASALAGTVFASLPALSFATHEGAKTDAIMLATFGAGVLFLLRHFRTGRRAELALAGLGLGIAFGTKWYGVSSVAVVVVVWGGVWLLSRRPLAGLARAGGFLLGVIAVTGGFWLVRNLVESQNPFFPTKIELLGLTIFNAPRDFVRECGGFTILSYVDSPGIWRQFILPDYADNYGLPGALVVASVVLALVLVGLSARSPRRGESAGAPVLTVAIGAAALAVAYAATPYSAFGPLNAPGLVGANTRWALPAFLVAAPLLAWVVMRLKRLGLALEVLAVVAVADGIRRGLPVPGVVVLKVAVATVVVGAGAYAAVGLVARSGTRMRLAVQVALAAAVAIGVTTLAYERQDKFNDSRFVAGDPTITWFIRNAPEGQRVGLAGVWDVRGLSPVLPAFGPRLGNEVAFVGEFVQGQLREYPSRPAFEAALRRGRYDLLLVGKGTYEGCRVPGAETDENAWATAAGFRKLAESERLVLYEVAPTGAGGNPVAESVRWKS